MREKGDLIEDGEGEDRDQDDRESDESAGDLLEEEGGDHEEGEGNHRSLRRSGFARHVLEHGEVF